MSSVAVPGLRTDVSVLYVDPRGPYPKLVADWWDEARDARNYAGPNPVVAHPPCGPWGNLKHMVVPNRERREWDRELGPIAVKQVQRWGGVLEQPSGSALFDYCQIPTVRTAPYDSHGGHTIEVEQVAWGHPARKATWLYIVGVPAARVVDEVLPWTNSGPFGLHREPTHWVSGGRKHERKGRGGVVPPGIKVCSAQQRRRTPLAFAEWLLDLAAQAKGRR